MIATAGMVEQIYQEHLATQTAMTVHLPRLRALADGVPLAVEFGVKRGASSSALLMGAERVISYDLVETPEARRLQGAAGFRWSYRLEDSRLATFDACDLILFDAQHDYEHVKAELTAHGQKARHFLVFHDVGTFGWVGARGETGQQKWAYQVGQSVPLDCLGIRPAIDEFQIAHAEWRIAASYPDSHGLLVLERR